MGARLSKLPTTRPRELAAEPPIGSLDLALGSSVGELRFARCGLVAKRARPARLVVEAVTLDCGGGPAPRLASAGLMGSGAERALEMRTWALK